MSNISVFFDLDGTLTDSGEGIINCAQLALRHYGIPCEDREALRAFVGPPLRDSFPKFGVPREKAEEAVEIFRSRYLTVGKFENRPYPGIRTLLEHLTAAGLRLCVATSKPETTAVEILRKFELADFFSVICGASMDGVRDTKAAVLAELLRRLPLHQSAVMVGDTVFDVEGAAAHGIPTIGVSWGYGDAAAMEAAGAAGIADTPEALEALLLAWDAGPSDSCFFH